MAGWACAACPRIGQAGRGGGGEGEGGRERATERGVANTVVAGEEGAVQSARGGGGIVRFRYAAEFPNRRVS